jgi:hypothetical protein
MPEVADFSYTIICHEEKKSLHVRFSFFKIFKVVPHLLLIQEERDVSTWNFVYSYFRTVCTVHCTVHFCVEHALNIPCHRGQLTIIMHVKEAYIQICTIRCTIEK